MSDHNEDGKSIPYARFQEVVAAKNAAEARLKELESSVSTLEANLATAQQEAEAKAAALIQAQAKHDMTVTLLSDGVDDGEVTEFLAFKYQSAKKDNPDTSFADWYAEYKASDPAVLKPFQRQAQTQQAAPTQTQAQTQTQQATQVETQQATQVETQQPKKGEGVVQDQSLENRTGASDAISNLTPHSLAKMTKAQIEQMGGMAEIIRRMPR